MTQESLHTNAVELIKVITEEIQHYRNRQFKAAILFCTMCGLIVYFSYTTTVKIEVWVKILASFVLVVIAILFVSVILISKQRGAFAKKQRRGLIASLPLPNGMVVSYEEVENFFKVGVTELYCLAVVSFTTLTIIITALH